MKVKTITCPNCSHANNFLAEECSQCGINFSKYYEELEKAEALRRHIEEQEKAEALKRQQQEETRAEEERRQREEEEKAEALRRQQEEEARQAEELKRQQEEQARAEEERRQREEEVEADPDASTPLQMPVQTPDFRPAETLQARLSPYEGQMIGITYGNPSEIQNVKLISVNTDHFQIYYPISKNVVSYAYRQLLLVTENPEGISAVGPDISPVFPIVIEVPRPFFA